MKYKTDNKWREMVCFLSLPMKAQAAFSYLEGEEHLDERFVKYKGCWYDVMDTMRLPEERLGSYFPGWHSYQADSYFSGVIFKLNREGDRVKLGTYCV